MRSANQILEGSRIESYGADYKFFGVSVHSLGGVVGRGKGDI